MMFSVAIDGPAGAGKSSVARAAAKQLGFIYVDTGALYRAVALAAVRCGTDVHDAKSLEELLSSVRISLRFIDGTQAVFIGDEDVSDSIRTPQVSMAASEVSAVPQVRAHLFDLQVNMAKTNNVIMDGRDIGTVVLPNAQVKIFLTASAEVRAKRRVAQLEEKGERVSYDSILSDIRKRDAQDTNREIAPLRPAEDAVLIDTSDCTFDESVEKILQVVRERM